MGKLMSLIVLAFFCFNSTYSQKLKSKQNLRIAKKETKKMTRELALSKIQAFNLRLIISRNLNQLDSINTIFENYRTSKSPEFEDLQLNTDYSVDSEKLNINYKEIQNARKACQESRREIYQRITAQFKSILTSEQLIQYEQYMQKEMERLGDLRIQISYDGNGIKKIKNKRTSLVKYSNE